MSRNIKSSTPDFIGVTIKGVDKVDRYLKQKSAQIKKASNAAVRVEGFRLKKQLAKEIRQGNPGGRRFAGLSYLRRYGRPGNKGRRNNPLYPLAKAVRYHVKSQQPYTLAIGFVGASNTTAARRSGGMSELDIVGGSWRRLADRHQKGFTRAISKAQREFFAAKGARLGVAEDDETPFFIKKTTTRFRTPARPIIDPFYSAEKPHIKKNIAKNFRLKMQGKRI